MKSAALAAVLVLIGCAKEAPKVVAGAPETLSYAPELKVNLSEMEKRPSGLYVLDLALGTGAEARAGLVVQVHYTGWLVDGNQFDSSAGGTPYEFQLGTGRVIAGWDEGVAGLKVGGKRRLVLPPQLGYGDAGMGVIPPGATLVFEVELVGVK